MTSEGAKNGRPLNPRQARFVEEYLKDLNATAAARRAGYAEKNADANATRLMGVHGIARAIAARKAERSEKVFFTQESVLIELQALAKSNVTNYQVNRDTGLLELAPGAPENAMAAVSSVEYETRTDAMGAITRKVKFKLWDKPGTLKLAGRHIGTPGFFDKLEVTGKDGAPLVPDPVATMSSDEQRRELARLQEAARARIGAVPQPAEPPLG